jgi:hypothetical protein
MSPFRPIMEAAASAKEAKAAGVAEKKPCFPSPRRLFQG